MVRPVSKQFRPPRLPPPDRVLSYSNPAVEKEIARRWRRIRMERMGSIFSLFLVMFLLIGGWLWLYFEYGSQFQNEWFYDHDFVAREFYDPAARTMSEALSRWSFVSWAHSQIIPAFDTNRMSPFNLLLFVFNRGIEEPVSVDLSGRKLHYLGRFERFAEDRPVEQLAMMWTRLHREWNFLLVWRLSASCLLPKSAKQSPPEDLNSFPAMPTCEYQFLWQDQPIGRVIEHSFSTPWASGSFQPIAMSDDIRPFFNFMVDESNSDREPAFAPELLEDDNWSMQGGDGSRHGISLPAIHLGGLTIEWRWRSNTG